MADERDPKLTRRYSELGAEEPPRELDQSILAAAHRAADRPHAPLVTPTGRHRWYFAFGTAAILVLAVAVALHVERQQPDPESVAPAPSTPPAAATDSARSDVQEQPARSADKAAPPAEAPKQEPAPSAADSVGSVAGSVMSRRSENRDQAAPTENRPAQAPRAMEEAELPPPRWLERIALLRDQERHEEADKALAEFRKRHPDYTIPEAMLQRIERK